MNRRFLLATAALLLLTLFLFFGVARLEAPREWESNGPRSTDQESEDPGTVDRTAVPRDQSVTDKVEIPAPVVDADAVAQAEQRVRDLEATLALARMQVEDAKERLATSEAEVTELEQMIDDIKARGEDPANYGDLAVERFQPAFFRYQDAQAAYDNAERLRAEAESALEAARAELARRAPGGASGRS